MKNGLPLLTAQSVKVSIIMCSISGCFIIRKILLLWLLISIHPLAISQVIRGTVYDKETRETIPFATLFFNGTFVGTYSNDDGNFELDISANKSMPLTVSAIGYYTQSVTDLSPDKPVLVYLIPKVYELKEVVVSAKTITRERRLNMLLFKDEFLGKTSNSSQCEILNEHDITFNYGSSADTLKAFCSKPILINNKGLGYKIAYYLDQFEYYRNTQTFIFKGSIIFQEDLLANDAKRNLYERRRKYAYLGSRMHFFRALWANNLKSAGFTIRNGMNDQLNYHDVVKLQNNQAKYLSYMENLLVEYYSREPGYIVFLKGMVFFDRNGYFDASGISWEGEMAKQRVADWLPFEYSTNEPEVPAENTSLKKDQ